MEEEEYAPEMEQPQTYEEEFRPETREEMEFEIVSPSSDYRNAYKLLQKDMVLSKLDPNKQRFIELSASIDSELQYLEKKENMDCTQTRDYFLRQAMVKVESSRAMDGQTLQMLRTQIQKYQGEQTMTQKAPDKSITDKLKNRLQYRRR